MHLRYQASNTLLSIIVALSTMPSVMAQTGVVDPAKQAPTAVQKPGTTLEPAQVNPENPLAQLKPEQWRKHPPTVPAPRPFVLPTIENYKLDNGLAVQLVSDHRFPFMTMALGMKSGSAADPPAELGLASMTADMLNEGTTTKKSKEIADEVDFIGGALKTVTDHDFTIVSGSALSKYSDRLIDILGDVVFHPTFPESELALAKTNLVQELAMRRSEPDFLVEERFNKVVFGNHPYAVVAPTPATIDRITRKDLQEFHDKYYLPNEATLVVVGDFDPTKMKEVITSHFGSTWKSGTLPPVEAQSLPKQTERKIYLVDRPGSVQSSIKIGNLGIRRTDPDYYAMSVGNQILGGAAHSRLFLNIREQKGYTYGAYSSVNARRQPGSFAAEAEVRTEVTSPSLQEFLYELDRIRNVRVTDKELADAKSYLIGSFQLGLETQSGLAQRLLEEKLYDLPADYLETYTSKVLNVTAEQVRTVARKLIDENHIVIAVVGDSHKILPELQYFAPVEVYDTSGKLSSEAPKFQIE